MQVFLLICGCIILQHIASGQVAVSINITQTASYCGGAAPPRELIEQLNTPVPLAGKVIYLRKGKTNKICRKTIELKSDSNGEIKTSLDPGFYAVVDETKKDKKYSDDVRNRFSTVTSNYQAVDLNCLDAWLKTPHHVIEVTSTKTVFQINFHQPCSWNSIPCVQYTGPMPP